MKRTYKGEDGRVYMVFTIFGFEYTMVEVTERERKGHPVPKFLGFEGFALKSCKKLSWYKRNILKFS